MGQSAPAQDRINVENGLNDVLSGLNNVTSYVHLHFFNPSLKPFPLIPHSCPSTDPAVTANVQLALAELQSASAAGNAVLANCN